MTRGLLGIAALAAAAACLFSGPVYAQATASPYTTGYRYDAMGRLVGTIAPDPDGTGALKHAATRNTYNAAGWLTKVETGELSSWKSEADADAPSTWGSAFSIFLTVETTYDGLGRKTKELTRGSDLAVASLTQYSYDLAGRLECTAVRMNPAIYGSLPASACTLGTEGSQGPDRITRNVYDAAGQLVQVREGVGTTIEAADVTYSYTLNGKKEFVIDANGNRAKLEYDGFGRQVKWIFPSPTKPIAFNPATQATALSTAGAINAADYEQYGYDANGNRTSLRKRDGSTLSYLFDALNRMTKKTVPERSGLAATHTRDVFYGYDLRGLPIYVRFDSATGEGISYGYDGFGNQLSEALTMDSVSRAVTSGYDKDNVRTSLKHPDGYNFKYVRNGVGALYAADVNGAGLFYPTYDAAGRVNVLYRRNGMVGTWGPTAGFATTFGYDPVSRLSSLANDLTGTTHDSTTTFTYNPASQIASSTRSNDLYAWNGGVNVNRVYTANGLNQYSAVAGTAVSYDLNGNLTSDGTQTYVYDVENRLVSRSGGPTNATLKYDPLGRLYEVNGSVTGTTRFLYDGSDLIAEYNASGAMLRRYAHGLSAGDDPLVWFEGTDPIDSTQRRYFFADERGSIVAVTDGGGNLVNVNTYDEYGIPGSANAGRFQYTGQAWIPELGMYYYKARMYSPTLGRFMQTDPIGYEDQFNLYAYVGNDPVNSLDPSGTKEGSFHLDWKSDTVGTYVVSKAIEGAVILWNAAVGVYNSSGSPRKATQDRNVPVPLTRSQVEKNLEGVTVYRVWGGKSGPDGHSWTPIDPRSLPDARDNLGLPDVNTAQNLTTGRLIDSSGVILRPALPLDGNRGGAPEILVPNPAEQIQVIERGQFDEKSGSR